MKTDLQKKIYDWLEYRAKFADYATHTEMKMQLMFTDWMGDYECKEIDKKRVLENCETVEEVYDFVKDTEDLCVHKEYRRNW